MKRRISLVLLVCLLAIQQATLAMEGTTLGSKQAQAGKGKNKKNRKKNKTTQSLPALDDHDQSPLVQVAREPNPELAPQVLAQPEEATPLISCQTQALESQEEKASEPLHDETHIEQLSELPQPSQQETSELTPSVDSHADEITIKDCLINPDNEASSSTHEASIEQEVIPQSENNLQESSEDDAEEHYEASTSQSTSESNETDPEDNDELFILSQLTPAQLMLASHEALIEVFHKLDSIIEKMITPSEDECEYFKALIAQRRKAYEVILHRNGNDEELTRLELSINDCFSSDEKDTFDFLKIHNDLPQLMENLGYLNGSKWRTLIYRNSKKHTQIEESLKLNLVGIESQATRVREERESLLKQLAEKEEKLTSMQASIATIAIQCARHERRRASNKEKSLKIKELCQTQISHLEEKAESWNSELTRLLQQITKLRKDAKTMDSALYNQKIKTAQADEKKLKDCITKAREEKSSIEHWLKNELDYYLPNIDKQGTFMGNLMRG